MSEATGCPDCGQLMEQTDNRFECRGCGHKGEQGAIELPEEAEQLTLF